MFGLWSWDHTPCCLRALGPKLLCLPTRLCHPPVLLLASSEAGRAHAARHLHATGDTTGCPAGGSPARPSPGLPAPWVRLEGVLDYIVEEGSDTYLLVRNTLPDGNCGLYGYAPFLRGLRLGGGRREEVEGHSFVRGGVLACLEA